ncbi:MAG TPA: TldD/PmbA family protein [Casimicrobiaceae bacterium]|nr:TldD/PmbA family protein [Casimicrobiaceae bacterium]
MPFEGPVPPIDLQCDFWSLRFVEEISEQYVVRKNVAQPLAVVTDRGVMATVYANGGLGYAATSDTSPAGLRAALERALIWANATASIGLMESRALPRSSSTGRYASVSLDAPMMSRREWYELLSEQSQLMAIDSRIVDWEASAEVRTATHRWISSAGGDVVQQYRFLIAGASATAFADGESQTRTLNGQRSICQQGASEVLARFGFAGAGKRIAEEALEVVTAPDCPTGTMDVLLAPDQMVLQVHESIGHPLELDRILGDERNFAGTSFVKPEMFGTYRYGSELLNITFDPTVPGELASYGWDDEGTRAEKRYLIRNGILERGLGGELSQARAGLPGVANSRADNWNRPPIDRMANLNLEVGSTSFDDMVAAIEHGVYMETNSSWSIDDSRNKFQFGCERARIIENGKLGHVVKNPNYRGISESFWRSLAMVGDASTGQVLGTPYCGKGEPSQIIRCGHASPACVFRDVAVFGGDR